MNNPIAPPPKKKFSRKPTIKQIKTVQYMAMGMSRHAAMKKAGYSPNTYVHARIGHAPFEKSQGVQQILSSMIGHLTTEGLTTEAMAIKFKEWINAQKIHSSHTEPDREVPDYETQIKAYDRWSKLLGIQEGEIGKGKIKRQMTVTEFINDEIQPKEEGE